MGRWLAVYHRLPVPLQNLAISIRGIGWRRYRLGRWFRREAAAFRERSSFTPHEWDEWVNHRLRGLIRIASERVPYYREHWPGLSSTDVDRFTVGDLQRLPVVPKDAVRAAPEAFLVDGKHPKNARATRTSGSTGTPVVVWRTPREAQRVMALRQVRSYEPFGFGFGQPRATFGGRLVVPAECANGPFHRTNLAERQLYLSAFHLSPANAAGYLSALRRHRPTWMTGYTHCFHRLALAILEQGLEPPPGLKAIVTTSEKLTPGMREVIEQAWQCRAVEEYSSVENAFFACEDPLGHLRIHPDAGCLEIVDDAGRPVAAGEEGRVLGTGFLHDHQLLIRYEVGDCATRRARPDTAEGVFAGMPCLGEVSGRIEDVVVGPDGRATVRFHGLALGIPAIRELQVVQEAINRLRIRVVAVGDLSDSARALIETRVHERLTNDVVVEIECVDRIPRTPAGKFRAVVSLLAR